MYKKHLNRKSVSLGSKQRGVVLIVGLVMVLLMTIVGMSAIRSTGLQENIAGNMRDRNLAFQASESALRFGETIIAPEVTTLPAFDCTSGLCLDQDVTPQNSVRYWDEDDWATTAVEVDLDLDSVAEKPRMILEELDSNVGSCAANEGSAIGLGSLAMVGDCIPFRITALGYGMTRESQVILQSAYKRHQ